MEKRILVVEDERSIAHLIAYNLERVGYRTATAANGGEALQLVESFSPHLLTLDLLLPRQSGWQVLSAIRAHPRRYITTLPVIVVSALASPKLREELRRNGVCYLFRETLFGHRTLCPRQHRDADLHRSRLGKPLMTQSLQDDRKSPLLEAIFHGRESYLKTRNPEFYSQGCRLIRY